MLKWLLGLLVFCMISCIVGCGQTGSLYLPENSQNATAKK